MSSHARFSAGQVGILLGGLAAIAAMAWLLLHLLGGASAAAPLPSETAPPPSLTPSPSPSHTPTPVPTSTNTPLPTATPLIPLACLPLDDDSNQAVQVAAVINGAYIEVRTSDDTRFFVRYLGVDPTGDGQSAAALNRSLVEGQTITLIRGLDETDEQGNHLRYVVAGNTFVNFELVRQGTALVGMYPPVRECLNVLLAGEALARSERLGYWGLTETYTPLATFPVETSPVTCDCSRVYTCQDFSTQSDAQACYNACGDYRNAGLDSDHNGLACDE